MSDTLLENLVIWLPVVFGVFGFVVVTLSILKEDYKQRKNLGDWECDED